MLKGLDEGLQMIQKFRSMGLLRPCDDKTLQQMEARVAGHHGIGSCRLERSRNGAVLGKRVVPCGSALDFYLLALRNLRGGTPSANASSNAGIELSWVKRVWFDF